MTNTERPSAPQVDELDELPPWDDAETLDRLAAQLTAADTRTLAIYGLDSDHRTLVGLGPVERARRSREAAEKLAAEDLAAAEKPDSQRMPQSEPPGPFIAAEDDELPRFLRPRKPGGWAIAVAAGLLVAAASLVLVRGRTPDSPAPSNPSRAFGAPVLAASVASAPPLVEMPAAASLVPAEEHAALPLSSASSASAAAAAEPPRQGSQASANAPTGVAALPVKLPELSSAVVVERASETDVNLGTINVTSNPPANVVLDGRPLGRAPRVVRVPAGTHKLVFIHPLYGRRALSVSVSPGMTTGASAEF
jgi:hypothetical protein